MIFRGHYFRLFQVSLLQTLAVRNAYDTICLTEAFLDSLIENDDDRISISGYNQKQPPRDVPRKRFSDNMQQMYGRTRMAKCDFNKVTLHGCSPVNLLHIFRTPFLKNTSGWLLLYNLLCADHRSNTKRGGVCIYYKDRFPIIKRNDLCQLHECLVAELGIGKNKFFFTCLCRCPSQTSEEFEDF